MPHSVRISAYQHCRTGGEVSKKGLIVFLIEVAVFAVFLFFRTTAGEQFANHVSRLLSEYILMGCYLMMVFCLPLAVIAIVLDKKKWFGLAALLSAPLFLIVMGTCG